tara:strand:+ start:25196 stop:26053 length:858 start_codon:yes stop_codon:yes gene_type:complete
MHDLFKINQTKYLNPPNDYSSSDIYPEFQIKLDIFKDTLISNIASRNFETYFKFGDGDYYFLNKIPTGSAKPGIRALKKPYSKLNHQPFVDGFKNNDKYTSLISKDNISKFNELIKRGPDYPSEIIYGLIANKWIFKNLTKKIGLIGAKPKIEIIKYLMEHDEYKNYLGLDSFNDYIYIEQNFACDNLGKTIKLLKSQLQYSSSELFLVGIGHVKSGVLHELKKIKPATYLDVGVGIDALAGVVNIYRPYFGNWVNFKLQNKKKLYKNVDILINNFGSLGEIRNI